MRIVWFIFVFACGVKICASKKLEEEYSWRDYKGDIPSDALPGGKDESGETTYIGQALHPGGSLMPGTIKKGSAKVFYEWGNGGHESEENTKILCSPHPERYRWISVHKKNSIFNLNGTQYIVAGRDGSGPYCVARRNTGSELAVGKALIAGTEFDRMWYATGKKDPTFVVIYDHYEILVFDPNSVEEHITTPTKVVNVNFYCD